jgi:aminoglycoside phosphotransferase family enzyme
MDEMKKKDFPEAKSDRFQNLYHQAAKDWEKLKANPYYLMNDPYTDLS